MDLESKYAILGKQCEELRKRITEMEKKFCEGEKWGKQACISLIDSRFEETKKNNEVQTNFREIIKQQEKERSELAQCQIVKVIQQKETMVMNIVKRKGSVIVNGLREDNIRNWQERKKRRGSGIC
ncbi:hypothetical protein E2C01_079337 [Portunus trituberculatus]|uniref:Uncharacterized protein n=1 Tax=Portunus trituberculatus TaxID=210409 RepID=A0A5B7IWN0_PORTR|nr:hypothetical protein [Portunus trituberculatus]